MGDVRMDDAQKKIVTVEEMAVKFQAEVIGMIAGWRDQLIAAPEDLEAIEVEVRDAFGRGADMLIAGLLAVVLGNEGFAEQRRQTCDRSISSRFGKAMPKRSACGFSADW